MTMQDLLLIIGKVSFIVLIVMSVLFGMTIAVQTFLSVSIKRILKNSRENFDKIADTNAKKECLKIIEQSKTEIVELLDINAKTKKLERKNKIKKAFNGKEKTIEVSALNAKDVFLDLFKSTASVFSYYGGRERGYLSFTEREIFSVIKLLRQRLEEIVDSSKIFWLKSVNISTFIIALNLYKSFENFKNKTGVIITIWLLDFFLWFGRVFSPHAITKYFLNEFAFDDLSVLIAKALVEVCGKELAYIYYQKSTLKEKLDSNEVA